jgi:hypothetical protein
MPLELLSSFYESLLSSLRGCKAICSRLSALAAVLAVVVAAAVVVVVAGRWRRQGSSWPKSAFGGGPAAEAAV